MNWPLIRQIVIFDTDTQTIHDVRFAYIELHEDHILAKGLFSVKDKETHEETRVHYCYTYMRSHALSLHWYQCNALAQYKLELSFTNGGVHWLFETAREAREVYKTIFAWMRYKEINTENIGSFKEEIQS